VIEQDVRFDATLGTPELRPREHREAQRNGGRIQWQQLVLESEFVFAGTQALLVPKARQGGPEQIFEQCRGPVFIGVRQRGATGRFGNPEVHQATDAAGKTVTDLAEGIGASELAKEHGYELCPAAKSLGSALSAVFLNQGGELGTRKMLEQLIEQAGSLYDCLGPPCGRRSAKLPARNDFANVQL
jgi:hypothetical protein